MAIGLHGPHRGRRGTGQFVRIVGTGTDARAELVGSGFRWRQTRPITVTTAERLASLGVPVVRRSGAAR
jgi:hypothetical protein